ncbi:MAG: hypothetical protein WEB58_23680 [Planctomycetaceae bacterium]
MLNEHEMEQLVRESKLTTSPALDERILGDVASRLSPYISTKQLSRRLLRPMISSAVAVLLLLACGMWWYSRPDNNTWAQVVKAVNEKPWIHLNGKRPDGKKEEMWFSLKHHISASRTPLMIAWNDFDAGITESYWEAGRPPEFIRKIVRGSINESSSTRDAYDFFVPLFESIFKGNEVVDLALPEMHPEIERIEQSRKKIRKDGKAWYEYVLTLHIVDHPSVKMIIHVDAESMLPESIAMNVINEGEEQATMTFNVDFPDPGPKDIYELGVPKDAKIVDQSPLKLAGEPKKIVDSIRKAAEGFEDYRAILVITAPEAPWHITSPWRVWKKGNRRRSEIGIIDPDHPPKIEEPTPDTNRRHWWKQWCEQLWNYPVELSEGKYSYKNTFIPTEKLHSQNQERMSLRPEEWNKTDWERVRGYRNDWPANTTPIVFAYPKQLVEYLSSPIHKTELTTKDEDAIIKTLIVTVKSESESSGKVPKWTNEFTYHLDPSRDYIVLHNSHLSYREENGERVILSESTSNYEDFEQSPKGYWYPTIIRFKSMHSNDGEVKTTESLARFYLDFDIEIPDSLFQPDNE